MTHDRSHRENKTLTQLGKPGTRVARKIAPVSNAADDTHRDLPEERAAWEGMTLGKPQACTREESSSAEELS